MENQKIENLLNLSLDLPEEEREKSVSLNLGYTESTDSWELIIRYQGDLQAILQGIMVLSYVELLGGYAILRLPEQEIGRLSEIAEIQFIEKPKRFFYSLPGGRAAACINQVQAVSRNGGSYPSGLTGHGVLVAVIDSGIDYSHPDFRTADGESRILYLWDQSLSADDPRGTTPAGYAMGKEFTREEINRALRAGRGERNSIVPLSDSSSGHGTAVCGIAAGNGNASEGGRNRGVATESSLLVVKLGVPSPNSFPKTSEIMQAVDYAIKKAIALKLPVALNLSFGNNYGAHDGSSLLETFLDDMAGRWKTNIIVASGNEGASRHHTTGILRNAGSETAEILIAERESSLTLQLWKNYADRFTVRVTAPDDTSFVLNPLGETAKRYLVMDTEIYVYYGEPAPYSPAQEILLEFLPAGNRSFINAGVYQIELIPEAVKDGRYHMWLPSSEITGAGTVFLEASPETSLTIPSTANRVITVGAYNQNTNSQAAFSGRGYTTQNLVKPTLAAPGVDITTASPNGGYSSRTGTSMAAPFVTGCCALMMEWGIVQGNDPALYGEKIKAYLSRGAKKLPFETKYPNPVIGYGALCLKDSFP